MKCVLPIRVAGIDPQGRPFERLTCTLDISGKGARISGLGTEVRPGTILTVHYKYRRALFRVTWVGRPGSRTEDQIGVVTTDPDVHFWTEVSAEELGQYSDQYADTESQEQEKVKASRGMNAEAGTLEISPEEATNRLRLETEELLELAALLERGNVDPAALQQFRQALAYVRNTSWILQQWFELKQKPAERFPLLKMLNTERLRIGISVCNELSAFVASVKVQLDPSLMQQFMTAVQQLFVIMSSTQEAAAPPSNLQQP
ncbi:MAG TPA: hypothetical protein VMT05_07395 [Terriglobales bacterium]|nr:hypothetical protein [Terriglobales bacterium]